MAKIYDWNEERKSRKLAPVEHTALVMQDQLSLIPDLVRNQNEFISSFRMLASVVEDLRTEVGAIKSNYQYILRKLRTRE